MIGMQVLDRSWQAFKLFIGNGVNGKCGRGVEATEGPPIQQLVEQFTYRESLGNVSTSSFWRSIAACRSKRTFAVKQKAAPRKGLACWGRLKPSRSETQQEQNRLHLK